MSPGIEETGLSENRVIPRMKRAVLIEIDRCISPEIQQASRAV